MSRSARGSRSYMERKMAIATAQCERMGHHSFKAGSAGATCREKIATGIEKHRTSLGTKRRSYRGK